MYNQEYRVHYLTENYKIYSDYCTDIPNCQSMIDVKRANYTINGDFIEKYFMINISLIPLEIGICLYAVTTLFTFLTLPVELDASNRALNWIEENNIVDNNEYKDAKSALKLAAMTYVLAALASLTELLRLISIVNSRKED